MRNKLRNVYRFIFIKYLFLYTHGDWWSLLNNAQMKSKGVEDSHLVTYHNFNKEPVLLLD
jgi:hypothetical protein